MVPKWKVCKGRKMQIEEDIKWAHDAYFDHIILKQKEDRIVISRPQNIVFYTEIVMGSFGTLFVHGDGPNIAFCSYRNSYGFTDLIDWAASSSLDYLKSKISMGHGNVYDEDLATKEIESFLGTDYEGCFEDKTLESFKDLLEYESHYFENEHTLRSYLYDNSSSDDYEYFYNIGIRPSWNLIAARAACKKAIELLKEQ